MQYTTLEKAQGICPEGWHIPSNLEIKVLEGTADSQYGIGDPIWDQSGYRGFDISKNLKSQTGWNGGGNGIDLYGFTARPGGYFNSIGNYYYLGWDAYFWSSTENNTSNAWCRKLRHDYDNIGLSSYSKEHGLSVRCILNYTNQPPAQPNNPIPEHGSTNVDIDDILSWSCSDPDGNELYYKIHFGTDSNPPFVAAGFTEAIYDPGNLDYNTNYYWKVIAFDSFGDSALSSVWNFTTEEEFVFICGDVLVDNRDSQSYNTIQIGTQCWMAENLNIGSRINGGLNQSNNQVIEKYCYNNMEDSCSIHGGLYQWDELMQYDTLEGGQGLCPPGWHVPSDDDWIILEGMADSRFSVIDPIWDNLEWRGWDAGQNIKSTNGWLYNGAGIDLFGFTALPTGLIDNSSYFGYGLLSSFWSSSRSNVDHSIYRQVIFDNADIYRHNRPTKYGLSVRCLNDEQGINQPPDMPFNPSPTYGSTNIGIDTVLNWQCFDAESNFLIYSVYFGTESSPSLVSTFYSDTTYDPGLLIYDTVYYWKIVAYDIHGDSTIGDIWNFRTVQINCGEPFTDNRDGKNYSTVRIGTQCWMAENLNIGSRIDGINDQTDNDIIEKFCYNDIEDSCDVYGGLYQWNEIMGYVLDTAVGGICPYGWHIPTDFEWKKLEGMADSQFGVGDPYWNSSGWRGYDAGGNLKESGTQHWTMPNTGATDLFNFTALPGGSRNYQSGSFYDLGLIGFFWTSNEVNSTEAWDRNLLYNLEFSGRTIRNKSNGFSLRCIWDKVLTNTPPLQPSNPLPEDGSINIGVDTTLSWSCSDPDGDLLKYNIYFGNESDPLLVEINYPDTFYIPDTLFYDTIYYWKIVAHDIVGDSTVGTIWNFNTTDTIMNIPCPGLPSFEYGGQTYSTVQIGTQCWMAENLNIGTMINGTAEQSNNEEIEKFCYEDDSLNCEVYGGLYEWREMMQYVTDTAVQGICPLGWYIPTEYDWEILYEYLGGGTIAGGKLKETETLHWTSPNNGATNVSGFTALPGGLRAVNILRFSNLGADGIFWTSNDPNFLKASSIGVHYYTPFVYPYDDYKTRGFSVRCIKDQITTNFPPFNPTDPSPEDISQYQPLDAILSWNCNDPENDPLTFDVYFGTTSPPPLVSTQQTASAFDPGPLSENTDYYWKIVAFDDHSNITQGKIWRFGTGWLCGNSFIDLRDGQSYTTVEIGEQCWMAENINIGIRIDGINDQGNNGIIEKYCYNDIEDSCDVYGGLYQWNELMQYDTLPAIQGICPDGWYIPTELDWLLLVEYVGDSVAGGKMKEIGTSHWEIPNLGATNESGFTGLPGGWRTFNYLELFTDYSLSGFFWSSNQLNTENAWYCQLYYNTPYFYYSSVGAVKQRGISVRCLKN